MLHPRQPRAAVGEPAVDRPWPPRTFTADPDEDVLGFYAPHPWRARVHEPGITHPHIIEHVF
jgi:hypothetical protein